ncbi:MAG: GIY-YIG nuclease family protein [Marmoricola sp.]
MGYCYILECSDGSYYVGSTRNLEGRVAQHNSDLYGAAYTRRRRPVRLVWAAEFPTLVEAFGFEKRVHGWGRAKRQALIDGRIEDLHALASRARRVS